MMHITRMTMCPVWVAALILCAGLWPRATWAAYELQIEPLPAHKLSDLSPQARESYDRAWAMIDKINYEYALEHLQETVELAPENA